MSRLNRDVEDSDDLFDELNLEDESDDYEEFDDFNINNKNSPRTNKVDSVRMEKKKEQGNKNRKIIILCVSISVAILMLVIIVFCVVKYKNMKKQEELQQIALQQQLEEKNSRTSEEDVSAGMPNLYANTENKNKSEVTSSDNITANLNGEQIDPNYKIKEIKTVTDFINFEKYRAVTDQGMEFYWLETTYKDKKYKVQVPLSIYKELENKGITVVDVEVTVLEDKSEVVTYMNVRKDAKSLIEKNKSKSGN